MNVNAARWVGGVPDVDDVDDSHVLVVLPPPLDAHDRQDDEDEKEDTGNNDLEKSGIWNVSQASCYPK